MAKHERKSNNIARCSRAYTHTTGVLCFLLSQVSHNTYNSLHNNHLHWFQKQLPTLSYFHAATPPPKIPKIPSSKQLFDLQSKTTRCFQQNHTSLSIKRYVVFGMMKYFQFHPLWHLWQHKNKTPSTRARIHARKNTFGQYPTIPSSNQTNQSTSPPFRVPSPHKNIHQRRNIHQQWNNHRQISNETTNNESRLNPQTNTHLHHLHIYFAKRRSQNKI